MNKREDKKRDRALVTSPYKRCNDERGGEGEGIKGESERRRVIE